MNIELILNLSKLIHHILIYMQTSGSIQDHNIEVVLKCIIIGFGGNLRRLNITASLEDLNSYLLSTYNQLLNCSGSVYVTGNQKRFFTFLLKSTRKLSRGSCFTGTLKTAHHNDGYCLTGLELNLCGITAHKSGKLFINYLDNHLARIQSVHYILTDSSLFHLLNKLLNNPEVYISLKQCHLDILNRNMYIFLSQTSLALKLLKYVL